MARGVADVLALYLDGADGVTPRSPRRARAPSAPRGRTPSRTEIATWVPAADGVVERFIVWNLSCALVAQGHAPLRSAATTPADRALLLCHDSEAGMQRALRILESVPRAGAFRVVLYGDAARGDTRSWVRRLADRAAFEVGELVPCGTVRTDDAFARSIVSRQPVVVADPLAPERQLWLRVASRVAAPDLRASGILHDPGL